MTATEDTFEARSSQSIESTYHLKWITWDTGRVPIVMQRINGPCPLIAIMNVLLLREKVKLPPMLEQITAHQLMTYLGECIMDSVPTDLQKDSDAMLNLEQNIHDAMEILPKLQTGLDVNVRFSGIADFEYTPECIIFDLLRIDLYHGWISDPTVTSVHDVVGNLSYNQLVDSIITNKSSTNPEVSAKAYLAEDFLENTASQLTTYGLKELKRHIKENELGVLFRNNHFITLFKRENNLFQLVTDHGFLTENIVWETLDNIEGDGKFANSNFEILDTAEKIQQMSSGQVDKRMQQLENDYLVALSLREEESEALIQGPDNRVAEVLQPFNKSNEHAVQSKAQFNALPSTSSDKWSEEDDFEMAKRLQEEEYNAHKKKLEHPSAQEPIQHPVSKYPRSTSMHDLNSSHNSPTVSQLQSQPGPQKTQLRPQSHQQVSQQQTAAAPTLAEIVKQEPSQVPRQEDSVSVRTTPPTSRSNSKADHNCHIS